MVIDALAPSESPQAGGIAAPLHASIYDTLRQRVITGQFLPGTGISTRGLALELGVSQMPVRAALSRLAAEGAVRIRSKRRIEIPLMNRERFADLLECRLLLEPDAAVQALPRLNAQMRSALRDADAAMDRAIEAGDIVSYRQCNFDFHFGMYRVGAGPVRSRLIETLWLQFAPHMRDVFEKFQPRKFIDRHHLALAAIDERDSAALRNAIADDIREGMALIELDDDPKAQARPGRDPTGRAAKRTVRLLNGGALAIGSKP